MNSFTPSSSLKLPYQSTKDILYGQSDHFSIPLSQLFSVANDFQDITPIGSMILFSLLLIHSCTCNSLWRNNSTNNPS